MASLSDKVTDTRNAGRPQSATVTIARNIGATTLSCNALTGWPTASKVHFVTYQVDTNGNPVAGTQLDCYGIVSGTDITQIVVVDGTDGGNALGDTVEMLPTAAWGQDLADALTTSLDRTGVIKDGAVSSATMLASDVVTTSKILDANVTNAKLAGSITSSKIIGVDKSILTTDSNPYKFSVYRNAAYNTVATTTTVTPFDSENFDTNNNHDAVTNKGRYTAPISGFYYFNGVIELSASSTRLIGLFLKNGAEIRGGTDTAATNWRAECSWFTQLTAGDYIEFAYYADAVRAITTGQHTQFSGFLVSRT